MTNEQWLYLVGSVLALIGSYFTAKLGAKANAAKVVADKEISSGQLALDIANRLDREVGDLRLWRSTILRWWSEHEDWDDRIVDELERLDPGALQRIGLPPRMPSEPEMLRNREEESRGRR